MTYRARFLLVLLLLLPLGQAFGQGSLHQGGNPPFTQQELDQMLAPIALYPDPLLAHVLMAATYPLEVVEAARWSRDNPNLAGDAAVRAVEDKDWDASVKSLAAFPQILQTMDQKIDWTERLGDAFLAQQSQVMDTVQALRGKAKRAGNLQSNTQVQVEQEGENITIEPAHTELIYVPYYDPRLVYGPWWWPHYPPIYWGPWYGYYGNGGIAWGAGFVVGVNFFFGGWNWRHHYLHDNDHGRWYRHERGPLSHPWNHDPGHRRGVPYRNGALDRRFGRTPLRPNAFEHYRGREISAPLPRMPHAFPGGRDMNVQPRRIGGRGGVFENVGHGADTRANSIRGRGSMDGRHGGSRFRSEGRGRRGH